MATIAETLALAHDHHMASRLAEAETLYARILDAEAAYRTMWRRWCAGLPPEPFDVPAAAGPDSR